jgi:hypothetical protein
MFAGDFYQLEPVKAVPLYGGAPIPKFHHWTNCFIELNGHIGSRMTGSGVKFCPGYVTVP